jgi:hypothetical protein
MIVYHIYGKNQVVILHKKLGEKIAETGYFAEFRPERMWRGGQIFVQIAQIPTFLQQKTALLGGFSQFFGFLFAISVIS